MKKKGPRPSIAALADEWLGSAPYKASALLIAFTAILWAPTLFLALHYWDDSVYLFEDPRLTWSLAHLWQILTQPFFANFHPVTTFTYLVDRTLWGEWVPGFHLTHLFFYAGSVALAYEWFRRLLGDRFWAFVGAALFSAHAIHVEPVAWLASRKDVVCLFWFLASLLAYERYAERAGSEEKWPARPYALVVLFTVFALGAKGYAAVLPLVFFAYDFCFQPSLSRRNFADKVPLLALALLLTFSTIGAQDKSSALIKDPAYLAQIPLSLRIEVLLKIFALYCGRAILPLSLNAKYIVGKDWYPAGLAWVGLALLAGGLFLFFNKRRTQPILSFSLALFALPFATTMNTFFTLRIWMTDRYLTLPTLGSCLALAWAASALHETRPDRRRANPIAFAALALVALYSSLTLARVQVWKSLVALRSDSIRKNFAYLDGSGPLTGAEFREKSKGHPMEDTLLDCLEDLVVAYDREGQPGQGREFRDLLRQYGRGAFDAASNDIEAGQTDKAIPALTAIVEKGEWGAPAAAKRLGDAYVKRNDPAKAREWFRRAFDLHRQQGLSVAGPLVGEMSLEFNSRNYPRALELLKQLEQEAPGDPRGPFFEGRSLEEMGKMEEAYRLYERVEKLPEGAFKDTDLSPAQVQQQMGITAQKLGRKEEAKKHFRESLRLDPRHPERATIEAILKTL